MCSGHINKYTRLLNYKVQKSTPDNSCLKIRHRFTEVFTMRPYESVLNVMLHLLHVGVILRSLQPPVYIYAERLNFFFKHITIKTNTSHLIHTQTHTENIPFNQQWVQSAVSRMQDETAQRDRFIQRKSKHRKPYDLSNVGLLAI